MRLDSVSDDAKLDLCWTNSEALRAIRGETSSERFRPALVNDLSRLVAVGVVVCVIFGSEAEETRPGSQPLTTVALVDFGTAPVPALKGESGVSSSFLSLSALISS